MSSLQGTYVDWVNPSSGASGCTLLHSLCAYTCSDQSGTVFEGFHAQKYSLQVVDYNWEQPTMLGDTSL